MSAPTDANVFRNWLADQFRADPAGVGRYAANACRPVRVNRRWWRGQRKMDRTAVKVDNADVPEAARTDPRWRLVPDEMKAEFQALERSVDQLVGRYVVEDENGALALGDGVYVVDAADLPEVSRRLSQFQDAWSRSADRWTTEDGYQRLHALLKEQVGEASYDRVKDLVPPRHELRARFALIVRPLAMRLVPDADDDPQTRAAVEDNTVTLLEAAVRRPREQLAAVLEGLACRLVTPGADDEYVPLKPSRTVRGAQQVVSRNIPAQALVAAREALDRYRPLLERADPALRSAWQAAAMELPDAAAVDAVGAFARRLRDQDADALRAGMILLRAARAARDESGMCQEFANRRRPKAPTEDA